MNKFQTNLKMPDEVLNKEGSEVADKADADA